MNTHYPYYPVINLAHICAQLGIQKAVISPGSRNAPLAIAFARHSAIQAYSISDERTAAFIALGIAQQRGKPTVLICTSGSAGLNYAPAVAEAYYSRVPLIVLTADRPPEWIDQADGQTIRQYYMFGRHCKAAYQLPVEYVHPDATWAAYRTMCEAIHVSTDFPAGPVHLNIPFREPFYPRPQDQISFDNQIKIFSEIAGTAQLTQQQWNFLFDNITQVKKILLVAGQQRFSQTLTSLLEQLPFPLFGDIFSNVHTVVNSVFRYEAGLQLAGQAWHRPDLLITFGQSVISKTLKNYLRRFPAPQHWHIQPAGAVPDVFQSLTHIIRLTPETFFEQLVHYFKNAPLEKRWDPFPNFEAQQGDQQFERLWESFSLNEPAIVYRLLQVIPNHSVLHLANSMPVRYAQAVGLRRHQQIEVFCNRGTSGIDGCVSTAVGHALASPEKLHLLIVGDVAFMYDRNALWHNYPLDNLRIVVLNNGGGGIFHLIDGPKGLPETDEYLVTRQRLSARSAAQDAGFAYLYADSKALFEKALCQLFDSPKALLLETFTFQEINQQAWQFIQPNNWKK